MSPSNHSRRGRRAAGRGRVTRHREHAVPEISVHPVDEESARLAEWEQYTTDFGVAPDHLSKSTAAGPLNPRSRAKLSGLERPSRRGRRHAYAGDWRSNTSSIIRQVGDAYDPEQLSAYAQTANVPPTAHLRTPSGVPADSDIEVREIDSNGRPIGSRLPATRQRSISTGNRPSEKQGRASVHFRPHSSDARPRQAPPRYSPALAAPLNDIRAPSARRARSIQRRWRDGTSPYSESSELRPSSPRHGSSRRRPTYLVDEHSRHDLADSDDSISIRPRRRDFGKDRYSPRRHFEERVYFVTREGRRRTSGTSPPERLPSQPPRSSLHREHPSFSHRVRASPSVSPARDYYSRSRSKSTQHRDRSSPQPHRSSPSEMGSHFSDKTQYPRGRRPRRPHPEDRPSRRRVSESRGAQDTRDSNGRRPPLTSYRSSSVPNPERYNQEGRQPSRRGSPAHQARPRTSRRMSKSEDDLPKRSGSQSRRSKSIKSTICDNKGKILVVAAVTAFTAVDVVVNRFMDGGTRVGDFVFGSKRSHNRPMDTRSVKSDSNGYSRRRPSDVRGSSPYAQPRSGVRWHRRSAWSPEPARRHQESPERLYEYDGTESPDELDWRRSRATDERLESCSSTRSLVGPQPHKYLQCPSECDSLGSVDDSKADEQGDPSGLSEEGEYDRATYSRAEQRYIPDRDRRPNGQGSGSTSPTHPDASRDLVRYNPRVSNSQHPSSSSPRPGPSTPDPQANTRSQSTQTEAGRYVATPHGSADYLREYPWVCSGQESPTPD